MSNVNMNSLQEQGPIKFALAISTLVFVSVYAATNVDRGESVFHTSVQQPSMSTAGHSTASHLLQKPVVSGTSRKAFVPNRMAVPDMPAEPASFLEAKKGWSALGLEVVGLAAAGGALLARLGRTSQQTGDKLCPEETSGRVHHWGAGLTALLLAMPDAALAAEQTTGYSQASYYTALGTYVLALPGLISLVTRSVKAKIVKKTFVMPGPKAPGGLTQKEIASKLLFFVTARRNFELKDAGKVVTFRGKLAKRSGQAAFLTFCVFVSLLSLGLVLQTVEAAALGEGEGLGNWWYAVSVLSPLAGKYYIDNSGGEQELQLKIVTDDAEMETEVVIQGDEIEVESIRAEFDWAEKGMVRVKGLFEM